MEIVLRLRADAAQALQPGRSPEDAAPAAEIESILDRMAVRLEPQHPGVSDNELSSYFTVSGLSGEQAQELADALRRLEPVESVYIQPPPSLA